MELTIENSEKLQSVDNSINVSNEAWPTSTDWIKGVPEIILNVIEQFSFVESVVGGGVWLSVPDDELSEPDEVWSESSVVSVVGVDVVVVCESVPVSEVSLDMDDVWL